MRERTPEREGLSRSGFSWNVETPIRADVPERSTLAKAFIGTASDRIDVIAEPGIRPVMEHDETGRLVGGAGETEWCGATWLFRFNGSFRSRLEEREPDFLTVYSTEEVAERLPWILQLNVADIIYRKLEFYASWATPSEGTRPEDHVSNLMAVRPLYMEWVDVYMDNFPELFEHKPPPPFEMEIKVPETVQ